MKLTTNRREAIVLILGDLVSFLLALWFSLFLRNFAFPAPDVLEVHFQAFSFLFVIFVFVFFIAGLYEKHTLVFESRLPTLLFNAQVANTIIALTFFYFFPGFGINPKTILFIYLVTASALIFLWRLYGRKWFFVKRAQRALLVGAGEEFEELYAEVNHNPRYAFSFLEKIDLSGVSKDPLRHIEAIVKEKNISVLVVDFEHKSFNPTPHESKILLSSAYSLFDFSEVYEHVFDRVPLGSLNESDFLRTAMSSTYVLYDVSKRAVDLFLGFLLTILGLCLYPFVYFLIKVEDGGPLFIPQIRIGERGEPMVIYKVRTMQSNESRSSMWIPEGKNRVTKIGHILRKTSLDEVPQVYNVFKGNVSLIGPRADIEGLGLRLAQEIPHYTLRTFIKPGISGWAQVQQIYKKGNISPQSIEETKLRLAYDLYYVKNRSIWLDLKIALRTITILLSRLGA